MTDYFFIFGNFLSALPTYLLNGILVSFYWVEDFGAALVSILCSGAMIWIIDPRVQSRAAFRPSRGDRQAQSLEPRTAQGMTSIVLVLWILSQWGMGQPVPWIGAAMWVVGTGILLFLRTQEFNLLWSVKTGIAIYALAVIGSRLYLAYTAQLSPEQWAALIGSTESAATVIASTRSNVTTIILWALWLVIPLGYFAMLLQQTLINPASLVNPLAGAAELIERYRMRR
jgi:hypothetical protein